MRSGVHHNHQVLRAANELEKFWYAEENLTYDNYADQLKKGRADATCSGCHGKINIEQRKMGMF